MECLDNFNKIANNFDKIGFSQQELSYNIPKNIEEIVNNNTYKLLEELADINLERKIFHIEMKNYSNQNWENFINYEDIISQ